MTQGVYCLTDILTSTNSVDFLTKLDAYTRFNLCEILGLQNHSELLLDTMGSCKEDMLVIHAGAVHFAADPGY